MSTNPAPYTIIKEDNAANHSIGTICYEFHGFDYGCAREDTILSGIPHISMTLNRDGKGPFFTIPVASLDPKPVAPYSI